VKLYIVSECGFVGQVGHCEVIYLEFVWFGGTSMAL